MPRQNGRDLRIKRGATVIAGATQADVNYQAPGIEVSGNDDSGFRTILPRPSLRSIDVSISGFTADDTLRAAILSATGSVMLTAHTIEYLDAADGTTVAETITGDFYLENLTETGAHDGGLEFSATLKSSGAFVRATP